MWGKLLERSFPHTPFKTFQRRICKLGLIDKCDFGLAVVDQIEKGDVYQICTGYGRTAPQIIKGDGDIGESAALRHIGTDHTVRQQQAQGHAVQYVHGDELFAGGGLHEEIVQSEDGRPAEADAGADHVKAPHMGVEFVVVPPVASAEDADADDGSCNGKAKQVDADAAGAVGLVAFFLLYRGDVLLEQLHSKTPFKIGLRRPIIAYFNTKDRNEG